MGELSRIGLALTQGLTRMSILAQRLLGLVGTADQILLHASAPNPIALVVSACLLAGAQTTETVVLAFINRLMGDVPKPPAPTAVVGDPPRRSMDGTGS